MKRWSVVVGVVVIASSLVGCTKPDSKCPEAAKAAHAAVEELFFSEQVEVDQRKLTEDKIRSEVSSLTAAETDLAEELKLFEQSMDCLVHTKDCCERLAKDSRRMELGVRSQSSAVMKFDRVMPEEVRAMLQPMQDMIEKDSQSWGDAKSVMAWCPGVRAAITKVRAEAPPLWEKAKAEVKQRASDAHARTVEQEKRLAAVREWAGALTRSKSAKMPAELEGGSRDKTYAVKAVAAYRSCE